MMGLWADGWFYISSAGLLVSGILFFFLLGQYRVASEAADVEVSETEHAVETDPSSPAIRPVYIPDETPSPRIDSHADKPEANAESKPKSEGEYAGSERRKDPAATTGGISPAVVYLQNLKVELADLHKDLRALAKRVDDELGGVAARDEALIERLSELTRAVDSMKAAAPVAAAPAAAPEPVPAPKKPRKAEKAAEPVVGLVLEAPAPQEAVVEMRTEPLPEPARPVEEAAPIDLSALVAPVQPEPQAPAVEPAAAAPVEPEPAAPQPAAPEPVSPELPPEEKPRRGPVWPV